MDDSGQQVVEPFNLARCQAVFYEAANSFSLFHQSLSQTEVRENTGPRANQIRSYDSENQKEVFPAI